MPPATLPSGRHPTVPETNTRFPLRTPKEYGPIGCATEPVFTICLLIRVPPVALLDHLIRPPPQCASATSARTAGRALLRAPPPARPPAPGSASNRASGAASRRRR